MRTDDNPDPVAVAAALTGAFDRMTARMDALQAGLGDVAAGERKNRRGIWLLAAALLMVAAAWGVTVVVVRQHDIAARVAADAAADRKLCAVGNAYRAADKKWADHLLAAAPWESSAAARADAARLRAEAAAKNALRDCAHLVAGR